MGWAYGTCYTVMLPYLAWVTFAAYLNTGIVLLNRVPAH